ncbi:hypothetical protein GCM10023329_41710 [Streptomyces sanyensis]|uniref:Uncharacterized protein n=1 Tax=Streptomyces sanyensis TaxID=568869 RepID=A0ABP9AX47_9ACTN
MSRPQAAGSRSMRMVPVSRRCAGALDAAQGGAGRGGAGRGCAARGGPVRCRVPRAEGGPGHGSAGVVRVRHGWCACGTGGALGRGATAAHTGAPVPHTGG